MQARQWCFLVFILNAVLGFPIEDEIVNKDVALDKPILSLLEQNIGVQVKGGVLKEGDIYVEQQSRHAVGNPRLTWRDRHVPYELDPGFDQEQSNVITSVMAELHDIVGDGCINFRPKIDSDRDFVTILKDTNNGCISAVGRNGGVQRLSLAPRCLNRGTIFHELMHTLGFWHEHTRPDRDQYIKVLWDNIAYHQETNFIKMDERDVVLLDRYDYYSIMHYSVYAFSSDNHPTIQMSDSSVDVSRVGQRLNLTALDIIKIRKLYNCDQKECQNPGTLKNGGISKDDLTIGSKITYKCNDGFALIGPSERICTDNGTWTGDTPVCLDPTKGNYHYCNFDNSSICGWHGNWTWTSFPTPLQHTGPTWDHTWDSSIGAFVYAKGEILGEPNTLFITSPAVSNENVDYCITFTLSMHGEMMGSLNVSSTSCGDTVNLQSWQGDHGDSWNRITLEVKLACVSQNFQISFEAGESQSTESDIAIDDVLVADCTTIQSFLDDQEFNRDGTREYLYNPWPATCQYMYIETSGPRTEGDVAKLSSVLLRITFYLQDNWFYCFSFYYNMYGESIGTLSVLKRTLTNQTLLWNKTQNQGKGWKRASVEFNTSNNEMLEIQATRGRGYRGDIAVDDFELWSGKCRKVLECDFEDGFCSWKNQNTSDMFDWLRHRGPTNTPGTGPTQDHTSRKGFYIYMEASSPQVKADTARLTTPFLPPTPWGYCFRFWLCMYGRDVGSLRLITRDQNGNETVNWSLTGEQSSLWQSYSLFLEASHLTIQIILEGEVGSSFRGDIAIDDVSIREENCYA
ncbi:MAM and LDL-receptor class A domain-containing protein 1-like [Pecten maximus]|uniref:MAM and LDL-receptor class A domain-containing protein 1-like n=1 Tax=Pecten maximus TaxID=6579 RepID=UPI00145886F9|nr:MAM and LDL-receptor class A domain-containing protein 1-like [Pecten maximus]